MKKHIILIALALASVTYTYAQCGSSSSHSTSTSSHHYGGNEHGKNIVEVASAAGQFNTLVVAVKAADLASTLQGKGPFTVFAPTDAAFAKLPQATVKELLQPANQKTLASILTYHVVAGEFNATDIVSAIESSGGEFTLKTVNGTELTATLVNGTVLLKDAQGGVSAVTATDVAASNGVIHIIDTIVMP